jgi:hypothetical protein
LALAINAAGRYEYRKLSKTGSDSDPIRVGPHRDAVALEIRKLLQEGKFENDVLIDEGLFRQ